jgi:hypothetical protein
MEEEQPKIAGMERTAAGLCLLMRHSQDDGKITPRRKGPGQASRPPTAARLRGLDADRASATLCHSGECSFSMPESILGHLRTRFLSGKIPNRIDRRSVVDPPCISAGSVLDQRNISAGYGEYLTQIRSSISFVPSSRPWLDLFRSNADPCFVPDLVRNWYLFLSGGNDRAKRQHEVCGRSRPDRACIFSWSDPVLDPATCGYDRYKRG